MSSNIDLSSVWPEWHVVRRINNGSFGVVYEAIRTDHNVESRSAIKVISIPQEEAEMESLFAAGLSPYDTEAYLKEIVEEFTNEIQIMESFKGSQNIVSVEDYKVVEKTDRVGWNIFIRMELLTPLNTYISDKTLSESDVIELGCDMCSALERCAQRNVIHRDIKPGNIFINEFGDYKLGDFGIARKLENMTSGLSQKGTYNYMAPEVVKGNRYDATVDIYSLGIVLYWLLNKRRLPLVNTEKKLLSPRDVEAANHRRLDGEPLPAPCNASPEMAEVVLKACNPDASKRFATATEMKKALRNVAEGKNKEGNGAGGPQGAGNAAPQGAPYGAGGRNAAGGQNAAPQRAGSGPAQSPVHEPGAEPYSVSFGERNGQIYVRGSQGDTVYMGGPQRGPIPKNSAQGPSSVMVSTFGERKKSNKPIIIAVMFAAVVLLGGGILIRISSIRNNRDSQEVVVESSESVDSIEAADSAEGTEPAEGTAASEETPAEETPVAAAPTEDAAAAEAENVGAEQGTPIEWRDPVLEAKVRSITGNYAKDFLTTDAELITSLDLTTDKDLADSDKIHDISDLAAFKNLRVLKLDGNSVEDISTVSGLTNLQYISVRDNNVRDISPIEGLEALEGLDLTDNYIYDLSAVRRLTRLKDLRFGGNEVTDLSPLVNLTNLTILRFSDNRVSNLAPLMNLTELTALRFSDNEVNSISVLSGLTKLRELWFYNNFVEDISVLSDLTELEYLYMGGNEISDASAVMNLYNLKELSLDGNKISSDQISRIRENIPDCVIE
ncbi:MAG: protein kinase [Lachnospiraceae bacterium]|nr:protein kinase [Lachnospiraceae bacterium]